MREKEGKIYYIRKREPLRSPPGHKAKRPSSPGGDRAPPEVALPGALLHHSASLDLSGWLPARSGGGPADKTTSRSAPMPHGIPIDAYMNRGLKSELIVLDRTRIGVLG